MRLKTRITVAVQIAIVYSDLATLYKWINL